MKTVAVGKIHENKIKLVVVMVSNRYRLDLALSEIKIIVETISIMIVGWNPLRICILRYLSDQRSKILQKYAGSFFLLLSRFKIHSVKGFSHIL